MSRLQQRSPNVLVFEFDFNTKDIPQNVIGSHILSSIKENGATKWQICPFTLANALTNCGTRYSKTLMDIIIEFDVCNPSLTKTMGGVNVAPYQGIIKQDPLQVTFDLAYFPTSLIVILYKFVLLTQGYSDEEALNPTKEDVVQRIKEKNTKFIITGNLPADSYARATPKKSDNSIKSKFEILNPGQTHIVNDAGGTARFLQRGGSFFDKKGNPYQAECNKPCWWHRHQFEGPAIGVPVRFENTISGPAIYMDGYFCSFECCLAFLNEEMSKIPGRREPNYENSRVLLRQLFEFEHPGEKLYPAKDWTLMRDVADGPLSVKEYLSTLKDYQDIKRPNYYYAPVTQNHELIKIDQE